MKRQDPGINGLDRACKQHDIAYSNSSDQSNRNKADNILAEQAWNRFKSSDASFGERATALGVASVMKLKSKLGMGLKKKKKVKRSVQKARRGKNKTKTSSSHSRSRSRSHKRKQNSTKRKRNKKKPPINGSKVKKLFRQAVRYAKDSISKHKPQTIGEATKLALVAAAKTIRLKKKPSRREVMNGLPRIIPVPKIGGALPLIPIFAGLSALGALVGGSSTLANTVISANNVKQKLKETKRHNEVMESVALGKSSKSGGGLYLRPHKKGLGLFVKPYHDQHHNQKNYSKN